MKSLCITGASSSSCQLVATGLYQAGLQPAKPLRRGSLIDLGSWHKRATPLLRAGRPLGRLWEKTAEELMLANLKESAWGWHDAQSLWALDFWAGLESGIHFLLLCESPENAVARALLGTHPEPDIEAVLEQWKIKQAELLRFYLDYPERSLLVDVQQAIENLPQLIACCNEKWPELRLDPSYLDKALHEEPPSPVGDFARQLGGLWCSSHALWIEPLWQELVAAQVPLVNTEASEPDDVESSTAILASQLRRYQQLIEEEGRCHDLEQALAEARRDNEQLEETLATTVSAHEEQQRALASTRQQAEELELSQRAKEAECESLLQSLHHTQEALELSLAQRQSDQHTFEAELMDARRRRDELETKCQSLLQSLHHTQEALELSLAQRQSDQHTFEAELMDARRRRDELETEWESLLQSLHQTQEALELSLAQRQADQHTFEAEQAELAEALAAAQSRVSELQSQNDAQLLSLHAAQERLEKAVTQYQADQQHSQQHQETLQQRMAKSQQEVEQAVAVHHRLEKEKRLAAEEAARLTGECEATLLAWQASQQQLETALKTYQQQKSQAEEYRQRLHALKRRAGPVYAADELTVFQPDAQSLEWHFKKLLLEEVEHETLQASAALSWNGMTVDITPADGTPWSLDTSRPASLNTLFSHQQETSISLVEVMKGSLSAWQDGAPESIEEWRRSLNSLQAALEQTQEQASLGYAGIELRHVQSNPDYEHLWITLQQAHMANQPPQDWHFRVSCANVTPGSFGTQPKLELPRQESQLLQGWFEESRDDFGSKLELRFALPEDMDVGIWMRLPHQDQLLLQSLLCQLPVMLTRLEQQGRHTGRDWQDWHRLAADMRRILQAKAV
ncbi:hypothetical protein [Chromohalobacter japonicus]|uniref:hypothetical protein n=1 Tax=Chromohalobacter japonicus TaxID=223900 RepID=UPI00058BEB33|nr:hypothetical protein [Chromohalobacter japonicus]